MKDKLKQILHDMRFNVFTEDAMVDYLLQHDVVPVVRCKDCKYFITAAKLDPVEFPNDLCADGYCDITQTYINEMEFCSYGERCADNV